MYSAGCCLFCVLCCDYIVVGHFYWLWWVSLCEGCSRLSGMLRGGYFECRVIGGYEFMCVFCFCVFTLRSYMFV